jgi:hypothetical protein
MISDESPCPSRGCDCVDPSDQEKTKGRDRQIVHLHRRPTKRYQYHTHGSDGSYSSIMY